MGHAILSQPVCQQLGLSRWHYLVVTPVGEEGRRVAGVDAGDGGEKTVALGYALPGTSKEPVHTAQIAPGGETGEVGGRIERDNSGHSRVPEVGHVAAGRWSGALRVSCNQGQVPTGGAAHEGYAFGIYTVASGVLLDPPHSASDVGGGVVPAGRWRKPVVDIEDHVSFAGEPGVPEGKVTAPPRAPTAAVDHDHRRMSRGSVCRPIGAFSGWPPDVGLELLSPRAGGGQGLRRGVPSVSGTREVSRERERYALGGGVLPRLGYRHQRDRNRYRAQTRGDQRAFAGAGAVCQGGHKQAEEGEGGEEEARLLEDHDDEALG